MRRILIFSLLFVPLSSWAAWDKVGETESQVIYIDTAGFPNGSQMRKVWLMHDLKERAPGGDMSRKTLEEHDCTGNRVRGISGSTHSGPKLSGKTIWSGPFSSEWHAIPPGSVAERAHKIICSG